ISWRWIFFVNVPIGIGASILTAARVQESRDPNPKRPDWPGVVFFTAGLASLVYGLIESGRTSFTATRVVACFVAAAVLIAAFLVNARGLRNLMFELAHLRFAV